ncbi:hypothetical protein F5X97DRAFT_299395 [Nemania serpens]|nr:hypothetical protein F5X97DRAFT_299395 [Nemania serpens]
MATEPWKSIEAARGYQGIDSLDLRPAATRELHRTQVPWHSKIRLPIEADSDREADFCHLKSRDLDCLIIMVRMLISFKFETEPHFAKSAIIKCACHNFGWDRQADYEVKGMLVSKLFPEDLGNMQVLRSKLTFENLIKHPGIDKALFGSLWFALKSCQLLISDVSPDSEVESTQECSYEDMTDDNKVTWDGTQTLEEAVTDQSFVLDRQAEGGTKMHERFCNLPPFIRVMYNPDEHHPRTFEEVRRFRLKSRVVETFPNDEFEVTTSDSAYILRAIVKMDPKHPIENPAEIRQYRFNGTMIYPRWDINIDQRPAMDQKPSQDSGWTIADPKLKFMLIYTRWDGDGVGAASCPPPSENSVEYTAQIIKEEFFPWLLTLPPQDTGADDVGGEGSAQPATPEERLRITISREQTAAALGQPDLSAEDDSDDSPPRGRHRKRQKRGRNRRGQARYDSRNPA